MQDELTLLAGVRNLDPQALAEAHDTYYPVIYRYISFRVGDHQACEDLTSEVFVRLLSAVRDRNAPQNTLRGWLYSVASHIVADYHRRRYRVERYQETPQELLTNPDPADTVSRNQTIAELYDALADLTEDQQNVISMRFGFGMPIREVAQQLGKSEGAVKQLQARAVAALSKTLTPRRVQA